MKPNYISILGLIILCTFTAAAPSGDDDSEAETEEQDHPELLVATDQVCYFLNGSNATDYVPCGTDEGVSNCCHSSDLCLSNGLCYQQRFNGLGLARGACTDKNWGPSCYAPCHAYERDRSPMIVPLTLDGNEIEYCCGAIISENGEPACEDNMYPFTLDPGIVLLGVAGLSQLGLKENMAPHLSPSKPSLGLAIGVGLGVPLGLLSMVGIFWVVWERRRRSLQAAGDTTVAKGSAPSTSRLQHRYGPIPDPYSRTATPPIDPRGFGPHAHCHCSLPGCDSPQLHSLSPRLRDSTVSTAQDSVEMITVLHRQENENS